MASSVKLRMNVEHLSDQEVNYELFIRNLLNRSETYYRRRRTLKNELDREEASPTIISYDQSYTATKDQSELLVSYQTLKDIYAFEHLCNENNVQRLETLVVHLRDRMSRFNGLEYADTFKEIREKLKSVESEILSYYAKSAFENNIVQSNNTPPNSINSTQANMNPSDIANIIERTVNRILDQRLPSQSSGKTPSRNRSNIDINDDVEFRFGPRNSSSNSEWQNSDNEDFPNDRTQSSRFNYRMSSTHVPNRTYIATQRINVMDWGVRFTGLDRSEDPKSMDVETFIRKIKDNAIAEGMNEKEFMSKVQQLLDGPAADWYAHKRRSIFDWSDFKYNLRARFARSNNIDDIRHQIYTKKQKPNEYTLRFIDQFLNLINRLPETVTEYRCLKYILHGIRPEIARMARTANVQSVDELIDYVKKNYGHQDKYHVKSGQFLSSTMKNKTSGKIELLSENDSDYSDLEDYGCESLMTERKKEKMPLSNLVRTRQQSKGQANNVRNRNIIQQTIPSDQSVKPQTNNKQPEKVNEPYKNPCPFCQGDHSYRDCQLPADQKQRHCFKCKSPTHIAPDCPMRENNKVQFMSNKQTNELSTEDTQDSVPNHCNLFALDYTLPPPVTFIHSVIFFPKDDTRPYATATVGDFELTGLLDTGAHATAIGQNHYEANEWKVPLNPHNTLVITADGTRHRVMGILLLTYKINGLSRIVPTLVLPIVMKKPIFGMDFQHQFNMRLVMFDINSIEESAPKQEKVFDSHKLSNEQQTLLTSVIETFPVVSEEGVLNCTSVLEHTIDTGNCKPVYSKPYIFSPNLQSKIRTEIDRMINRGIIRKINDSEWLNPVVPVTKPDGSIRLCLNAKKLNAITKKNRHNPTNIERIFARLPKARYFSSIDLKDAFYQIPLAKEDQQKTAFSIHGLGMFCYERMPQGLVNSAATLNKLVETMFNAEDEPETFVYVDDFIIGTETFERHIEMLKKMARKLKNVELAIGIKKSIFCMKTLKFLGHQINEQGISIDSSRLQAITTYKKPTNAKEVRTFLGFTGWHRKFIENYAEMSAPLVNLTKKTSQFEWTSQHEEAYENIKNALLKAKFLCNPDYTLPFHIDSVCSYVGTGAVLYQIKNNEKRIIAYMSVKLNDLQQKYHPVERECFALIVALEKFRHYTEGNKIIVTTDQCSLNWLRNCKDPTGRIARWSLRLQAYDFEIKTRQFSQREPISVLSRELDLNTTPSVSFHSSECEHFESFSLSNSELNFTQSNMSVVEILDKSKTQDGWYRKQFEQTESDPNNEYFKIENEILYHRFDKIKNIFENEWKICVPQENRSEVLKEQHDSVLASHPGIFKTIRRIQSLYYWPKMTQEITEYVQKCEICRTTKPSNINTNSQMGQRRETNFPFRTLSTDFIGPMTMSKKQNRFLLVVIDNFTKFVCLKPMRMAKAENVTKFLEEEVFLRYGVCENLICDNGVQFASKALTKLMEKYNSNLRFTPFYYPQANPCEIANKSIINAIRSYVIQQDNQRNWDAELSAIACALNSHVHTSTNMSPFFAFFGHEIILNGNQYAKVLDVNDVFEEDKSDKMVIIRHSIREHLFRAYLNIEKAINKRAGKREIDITKDTYLRQMKLSNAGEGYSKKLGEKYIPVTIVEKIGENTFKIADKKGKTLGIYHSSLLMQR